MRHSRSALIIVCLLFIFGIGLVAGRQLLRMGLTDSPGTPETTSGYSLEDIYNRLDTGAPGTPKTFIEPVSGPGSGTMRTLDEIMGLIPDHMASFDGADGVRVIPIPDGIYEGGKTATAKDDTLTVGNIKENVKIFGVTGTYAGPERFENHGNGTVTDKQTGLMWTQSMLYSVVTWQEAVDDCEDLVFPASGHDDWRLPEIWELYSLLDVRTSGPPLPDGHPFTNYPSSTRTYWSGTTAPLTDTWAWIIYMSPQSVNGLFKTFTARYWPVRDP